MHFGLAASYTVSKFLRVLRHSVYSTFCIYDGAR